MQTSPVQNASTAAKLAGVPLERIAANPKLGKAEKLEAACKAFEAVLLRQILDSAQKVVIPSSGTSDSASSSIYRDMVTSQMADQIAASGQFGVARSFLDQIRDRSRPEAGSPQSPPTLKPFRSGPVLKAYRHE